MILRSAGRGDKDKHERESAHCIDTRGQGSWVRVATIAVMAEGNLPVQQQLEEIGAQLDWVREYL